MKLLGSAVAAFTGIPIGIVTAIGLARPGWASLTDFLVTAFLGAAIVGLPQGILAQRHRNRPRTTWRTVAFVVSMILAGTVMTTTALIALQFLPHGQWVPLPPPPERAAALLGPDCYDWSSAAVFVRSSSGHLYRFQDTHSNGTWISVDSVPVKSDFTFSDDCHHTSRWERVPSGPSQVVTSLSVAEEGADCDGDVHYALRTSGEIWSWADRSCIMTAYFGWLVAESLALLLSTVAALSTATMAHHAAALSPPAAARNSPAP